MPLVLKPQAGFQEQFATSRADITIGGGAAFAGKTFICLLEAARGMHTEGFSAVFFRRTTTQVHNPGGLWDEATKIYPLLGAWPTGLEWHWPSGAKVKMAHLEYEKTVEDWQGSQVPLIVFDELPHFTSKQFWYMVSRNRGSCGIRSRILATCNPDADSWVATLIEWWIEQDDQSPNYGFAIPERAGKLRYFTRVSEEIVWGDTAEEVMALVPGLARIDVQSITFVPGKIEDNIIGNKKDPTYRGKLMAMSRVERARLLMGNWKVRASSGDYFQRNEVRMLDAVPEDVVAWVRRWDLAATEPSETNKDPDWTCGVKLGRRESGRYVVGHVEFARKRSDDVRKLVLNTAHIDGSSVKVIVPRDPGQAGVDQADSYVSMLAGFDVETERETGPKETRVEPFSAQWQAGNVDVVKGPWNAQYFSQMEGFPAKGVHDDAPDASAGAFKEIANALNMWDVV
jgi:predicted phage terminase large subunit-like protein